MFEAVELGQTVSKETYEEAREELRVALVNAQYDVRHRAEFSVSIILGGDDRLGINDVITELNRWMDARYLATHVLHTPSDEERQRPRFWRFWRRLPRAGEISLSAGGLSSEVLRPRLLGEIGKAEVGRRCERITRFEDALHDDGAVIVKIWLHLPKKEARKRLTRARKDPDRAWMLQPEDKELVKHHRRVMRLAEDFLRRTDTAAAPWHLVESTDRHHRDLAVGRLILDAIQRRLDDVALASPSRPVPSSDALLEGHRTVLDTVDLSASLDRDEYRARLASAQRRLNAAHRAGRELGITTVLAFEGWDAAGKGGCIRRLTTALDAGHFAIAPIAAPTEEELAHHYLWRFWMRLPRAGVVQIFDRSWYGRVLVERVEQLTPEESWRRAYGEINDFEQQLVEHGSVVCKFWLHVSPEEQLRRFEARQDTPYKHFKLTGEDWRNRDRWDDYALAVHDMVERTSTHTTPWHLVAAEDKRWARVQVLETVTEALEAAVETRR